MARGPHFIDRSEFAQVVEGIRTQQGAKYQDVDTIYGDMSRLVVALLATTPPARLRKMYNELGWEGSSNARALHEAAKHWLRTHHPERAERLGIEPAAGDDAPLG